MYNVLWALIPLGISFVLRQMTGKPAVAGAYAPEILFFGIMVSVSALGDLTDEINLVGHELFLQTLRDLLILGAVIEAVFFGMYQFDQIVGPGNLPFEESITLLSLVLAVALGIASVLAEVLAVKIRGGLT